MSQVMANFVAPTRKRELHRSTAIIHLTLISSKLSQKNGLSGGSSKTDYRGTRLMPKKKKKKKKKTGDFCIAGQGVAKHSRAQKRYQ